MFTKLVTITPEMAREYLSRGAKNRNLRMGRVQAYARDIIAGNWKQTGETIKFGVSGKPLDGQHRLNAIIKANCAVTMLCAYDVDDSAFDYIDTGLPRAANDILGIAGVANASTVSAACRHIVQYERGIFDGLGKGGVSGKGEARNITNHEIVDALERHPGVIEAVTTVNRLTKDGKGGSGLLMGGGLASFFVYQFTKQSPSKAAEFFMGLAGRLAFDADSPVFRLRERLIANKIATAKLSAKQIAAITIKSWVAFRDGVKAKERLVFRSDEAFPTF